MIKHIYKVFRAVEWEQAISETVFKGSPDDIRDGFIHFSTRAQLEATVAKYFADEPAIHITEYLSKSFNPKFLKWEKSRGSDMFPHLYTPLDTKAHTKHWRLIQNETGLFDFSALPKDM